jgi:hypothetical protein
LKILAGDAVDFVDSVAFGGSVGEAHGSGFDGPTDEGRFTFMRDAEAAPVNDIDGDGGGGGMLVMAVF